MAINGNVYVKYPVLSDIVKPLPVPATPYTAKQHSEDSIREACDTVSRDLADRILFRLNV
jgi:hypothetical protein